MKRVITGAMALVLLGSAAPGAFAQDNSGYNPAMRRSWRNTPDAQPAQPQAAPPAQAAQAQPEGQGPREGRGDRGPSEHRGDRGQGGGQGEGRGDHNWQGQGGGERRGGEGWQGRGRPPQAEQPQAQAPRPDQGGRDRNWNDHRGQEGNRGGDRDRGDNRGRDWNRGENRGDGRGENRDWNRGDNRNWERGDNRNWSRGDRDRPRPRYDQRNYPSTWRSQQRFRGYAYRAPPGFYARSWGFGDLLPRGWWTSQYRMNDWWDYGLPVPPIGYEWVRVGDDALLVDMYTGRVVQVAYNLFW